MSAACCNFRVVKKRKMVKHIGRNLKEAINVDDWFVNGSMSIALNRCNVKSRQANKKCQKLHHEMI